MTENLYLEGEREPISDESLELLRAAEPDTNNVVGLVRNLDPSAFAYVASVLGLDVLIKENPGLAEEVSRIRSERSSDAS